MRSLGFPEKETAWFLSKIRGGSWELFESEQFPGAKASGFDYNLDMKILAFRGIAIFCILIVATSLMMDMMKVDFGTISFWDKRGVFFLFFVTLFPRLTLLFSSVAFGGVLWWLGFFFCPRILVATLATMAYFHTNPILVIISWVLALGGEVFEKWGIGKNRFMIKTYRTGPSATYPRPEDFSREHKIQAVDVIEAEFKKKD